ncbi:MAG: hypothetical protein WBL50_20430 [Candidatus Acidiferrum sp.]
MSDPKWLKEPDKSGDSIVYVSIPEGSQLTPELKEALTRLGKALQDLGEKTPEKRKGCSPFTSCTLETCQPHTTRKCFWYQTCRVKE